jgi:hypothetical protein
MTRPYLGKFKIDLLEKGKNRTQQNKPKITLLLVITSVLATSRPSNTMNVGVNVFRKVHVDDVGHELEV